MKTAQYNLITKDAKRTTASAQSGEGAGILEHECLRGIMSIKRADEHSDSKKKRNCTNGEDETYRQHNSARERHLSSNCDIPSFPASAGVGHESSVAQNTHRIILK